MSTSHGPQGLLERLPPAVEVYTAVDTKSEISFRQISPPCRRIIYTKTVNIAKSGTPTSSRATCARTPDGIAGSHIGRLRRLVPMHWQALVS